MLDCAPRIPDQNSGCYNNFFYPQQSFSPSGYSAKCSPSPKDSLPQQTVNSVPSSPRTDIHYPYTHSNQYYTDCIRNYNLGLFNQQVKPVSAAAQYYSQQSSPPCNSIQQSPTSTGSTSNSPIPLTAESQPPPFYWSTASPYIKSELMLQQLQPNGKSVMS